MFRKKRKQNNIFPDNLRRSELLDLNFKDTVNPHMMELYRGNEKILYVINEKKERITSGFKPDNSTWYRKI